MRVILRVTAGPHEGKSVWLRGGQALEFGRADRADHSFSADAQMSGVHFRLSCDETSCRVTDLRSSNGTMVNGQRIQEQVLADGDEITAGCTRFRVEIDRRPRTSIHLPANVPLKPRMKSVSVASLRSGGISQKATMRPSLAWLETFLPSSAQPYRTGLTDPDEGVRREVAWAAAWTRQTWLIEYCRAAASEMFQEDAALFQLLAVLGKPVDLERIVRLARHERLGPARMALLGSFGHPQCVEQLIAAMSSEDVRTAVAAGLAFTKITGVDVDSGEVTTVTASGKDSSGESSLDEELVTLPDAKAAQRYWKQARPRYVDALRWCRGVPLNRQLAAADWNLMDASSGLEICLREHYEGVQRWAPDRIARFPQLRGSTGERPLPSGQ